MNNSNEIKSSQNKSIVEKQPTYKISVIVPIYNNGNYLKNHCIKSLKKSSIFNDMEIILIDDGSTDNITPQIITELENEYKNIKSYFFNDGGSGSASRPRNKGLEIATTEYIKYLDPDDEEYNDGSAKLYKKIISNNYDLVIGNIIFKSKTESRPSNTISRYLKANNNSYTVKDGKMLLIKTHFMVQSIQACIIKKSLIINNNLNMVFGGAGQDTLFFYELLINANKIQLINDIIHVYHTSIDGSITNNIVKSYFEKHLPKEYAKRNFLQKNNLLSYYLKSKQDHYFKHFILKKLNKVTSDSEREICLRYIDRIYKVYYDIWKIKDPTIKKYVEDRLIFRDYPFDKTLIIYLTDDYVKNDLFKLDKNVEFSNTEIILVDYYLTEKENINILNFESNNPNVKLYCQNLKENINISELEKRVLNLATTNNLTIIK